jgi:hypothetical protein
MGNGKVGRFETDPFPHALKIISGAKLHAAGCTGDSHREAIANSDFCRAILGTIECGWPRTLANKSVANASPTTEFPFVDNGWFHRPTLFRWLLHLVRNRRNVEQAKDEITRDYRRSIFAGTESAVLVSADRKY